VPDVLPQKPGFFAPFLTLKLKKIMNEKMSKRRIQIRDLQKQEIEEKQERRLLIRLHIFYLILLINL
jgi:hypothetical protein